MAATDELIRTTCPRDCYDACGALVVRREGAIHAVRGDPDHPVARGPAVPEVHAWATTARSSTPPRA